MGQRKSRKQSQKHDVSFEEAQTVFGDSFARIFDDEQHSFDERHNGIVGHSAENRLLIISFTEKESDTIRIISARETTPTERRKYENADG
jgi:hypothetical protein